MKKNLLLAALVGIVTACSDPAAAQDNKEATTPRSTVEAGVGGVSADAFKAGEYNGLQRKGVFVLGNVDLRGGAAYDSGKGLRWRIKGTDLGLETRSLSAEIGVQSKFRLTFGYDELLRNRSDSYQTPYNGAGTNVLTLPGTWLVPTVAGSSGTNTAVNNTSARGLDPTIGDAPYTSTTTNSTQGALLTPTAAQKAQVDAAAAADVPLFHSVKLSTKRTRYDVGANYAVTSSWDLTAALRSEHKDGLKPMGTVSRNTGADISTVIPDLIDTHTNQINLVLKDKGPKTFAESAYYGSFFTNDVPFMSWQNWATGGSTVNTMSSTPANRFNQARASVGYAFSPTTKLVASGSYARSTQNATFLTGPSTPVVPVASLDGLVVTSAFNVKFTARPVKKLALVAAYKFDDHDNRTPVHIYQYADAEEAPAANANFPASASNPLGAVVAQNANANRAYSRQLNLATFDADYAVTGGQWIKAGYDFERINRECNGSWASCADAAVTNENSVRAEWRLNPSGGSLNARVGYTYSARRSPDYNENAFLALVPYANVAPATATGGATAYSFMTSNGWNGWGPGLGYAPTTGNMNLFFPSNNALANATYANNNRISELMGLRRYYVADRDRNKLRGLVGWQAAAPLFLQASLDLTDDRYPASIYGVQNSKNRTANVEATYLMGEAWSASAYYTHAYQRSITAGNTYTANSNAAALTNAQPGAIGLSGNSCDGYTTLQQRNNNNKLDPCLDWSANMLDRVNTAGVALGAKSLAGKLDLTANLLFSRARSDNNVSGGNWANNALNAPGGPPTTIAAYFIQATALPTVSVETRELHLDGRYAITRRQSVRIGYWYSHMNNADWMYAGMQIGAGTIAGVLPSLEQGFNYGVSVVAMSYILSF